MLQVYNMITKLKFLHELFLYASDFLPLLIHIVSCRIMFIGNICLKSHLMYAMERKKKKIPVRMFVQLAEI